MAPPKVDLNGKEKLAESLPTAVVVEQSAEASRQRCDRLVARRRRRCRVITALLVLGVVIVGVALSIMVFSRHHRRHFNRWNWCGTKDIPEHVKIDYGRQLIFVNNSKSHDFSATHALHDYKHKVSAFRDPQHRRCFLEPLNKEFREGLNDWDVDKDTHAKPELYFRAKKPMETEDAKRYWGESVANHCHGHKIHMMSMLEDRPHPPAHQETMITIKIASNDAVRIIFIDIRT